MFREKHLYIHKPNFKLILIKKQQNNKPTQNQPQTFLSTSYIKGKECLLFTVQEPLKMCNVPQDGFVNVFQELCF